MTSLTQCDQVLLFGEATASPRSYVVNVKFDIDVVIRSSATDSAASITRLRIALRSLGVGARLNADGSHISSDLKQWDRLWAHESGSKNSGRQFLATLSAMNALPSARKKTGEDVPHH